MPSTEFEEMLRRMRIARKTPPWLYSLQPGAVKRAGEYEMFSVLVAEQTAAGWIAKLGDETIIVEPAIDMQVVAREPLAGVVWERENNGMPYILENGGMATIIGNSFLESKTLQDIAVALFFLTFD